MHCFYDKVDDKRTENPIYLTKGWLVVRNTTCKIVLKIENLILYNVD